MYSHVPACACLYVLLQNAMFFNLLTIHKAIRCVWINLILLSCHSLHNSKLYVLNVVAGWVKVSSERRIPLLFHYTHTQKTGRMNEDKKDWENVADTKEIVTKYNLNQLNHNYSVTRGWLEILFLYTAQMQIRKECAIIMVLRLIELTSGIPQPVQCITCFQILCSL